jgi:hypothetical protein
MKRLMKVTKVAYNDKGSLNFIAGTYNQPEVKQFAPKHISQILDIRWMQ